MAAHVEVDFPQELSEKLTDFRERLKAVETLFEPVCAPSFSNTTETLEPLERARLDLVSAYALNSLFFMYLRTKGEDAQEHEIKKELERIRSYMDRLKNVVDRQKASRVDVPVAKRFVRHALWTGGSSEKRKITEDGDGASDRNADVKSGAPAERRHKTKR